jgi:hypothetical protein
MSKQAFERNPVFQDIVSHKAVIMHQKVADLHFEHLT